MAITQQKKHNSALFPVILSKLWAGWRHTGSNRCPLHLLLNMGSKSCKHAHRTIPTLCLSVSDYSPSLSYSGRRPAVFRVIFILCGPHTLSSSHAVCYFWLCHCSGDRKKHHPSAPPPCQPCQWHFKQDC